MSFFIKKNNYTMNNNIKKNPSDVMLTLMKKLWTSRNKKQHIIYGMYFSEQQGLLHSRETLLV